MSDLSSFPFPPDVRPSDSSFDEAARNNPWGNNPSWCNNPAGMLPLHALSTVRFSVAAPVPRNLPCRNYVPHPASIVRLHLFRSGGKRRAVMSGVFLPRA